MAEGNEKNFTKLYRNEAMFFYIARKCANAIVLLGLITIRARYDDKKRDDVEIGQAFIGDYKELGLSEQEYRTAKKWLETLKIATFKGTNKGTVATVIDTSLFDYRHSNLTGKLTGSQRAANGQLTTNKKIKGKKEKENYTKEKEPVKKVTNQGELKNVCVRILKGIPDGFDESLWEGAVNEAAFKVLASFEDGDEWKPSAIRSYAQKVYVGMVKKNANA